MTILVNIASIITYPISLRQVLITLTNFSINLKQVSTMISIQKKKPASEILSFKNFL